MKKQHHQEQGMKLEDIELKIGFELKKFVIEELQKIADGMNKTAK